MWDAALYNKLGKERMQPSIDLTARCRQRFQAYHRRRLSDSDADIFLQEILREIKGRYAVCEDGNVLFEFKRMFLLAEK